MAHNREILIIDDEKDICELIADVLQDEGYIAQYALSPDEALQAVSKRCPSLVILDIWLGDPKQDGLSVLKTLKKNYPLLPVLMMSGHGTIETAVQTIKEGAYDFIEKPFKSDRLLLLIQRALEASEMAKENSQLKEIIGSEKKIIGDSNYTKQLLMEIERIAPTNSRVIISGPSGSGKEVVARQIHRDSTRSSGAFVTINCDLLTDQNFETILFGKIPSSTSQERLIGVFEKADRGTLFLENIEDLPQTAQTKLVRILHESSFTQEGSEHKVHVDVRVLSSTKVDLKELVKSGKFREDLYYRLNVVSLDLLPLKDRREDIISLINTFNHQLANELAIKPCLFSDKALTALKTYEWHGNVRQLKNAIENILILNGNSKENVTINTTELPSEIIGFSNRTETPSTTESVAVSAKILQLPLREARESFEREYLVAQVDRFSGNISQTASFVGMERSALHRKLRALDVKRGR